MIGGMKERFGEFLLNGIKMSEFCVGRSVYEESMDMQMRVISAKEVNWVVSANKHDNLL